MSVREREEDGIGGPESYGPQRKESECLCLSRACLLLLNCVEVHEEGSEDEYLAETPESEQRPCSAIVCAYVSGITRADHEDVHEADEENLGHGHSSQHAEVNQEHWSSYHPVRIVHPDDVEKFAERLVGLRAEGHDEIRQATDENNEGGYEVVETG